MSKMHTKGVDKHTDIMTILRKESRSCSKVDSATYNIQGAKLGTVWLS